MGYVHEHVWNRNVELCMWTNSAEALHSPHQASKYLRDVGVVASRFGDGDAQLSITQGAQGSNAASKNPNHQGQTHRARVLQDPLRRDEDTRANDVPWGDGEDDVRHSQV